MILSQHYNVDKFSLHHHHIAGIQLMVDSPYYFAIANQMSRLSDHYNIVAVFSADCCDGFSSNIRISS